MILTEEMPHAGVLKELYGINNENPIKLVDYETLLRVIGKYGKNGFFFVSEKDSCNDAETVRSLITVLKTSGFCYLPVYREQNGSKGILNATFIVFGYSRNGMPADSESFLEVGLDIANRFSSSFTKSNQMDYTNCECYVNPNPNTLNEFRRRKEGFGEIILGFRSISN